MSLFAIEIWPIASGALTALASIILGFGTSKRSRRLYYSQAKADLRALPFLLPELPNPALSELTKPDEKALYELVQDEHRSAKVLQDQTVAYLVGASTTLFAAFAASVASITLLAKDEWFHLFAATLDLMALMLFIWAFRRSGINREKWITQRIRTELLRQWAATDYLLVFSNKGLTSRFDAFSASVAHAIDGAQGDKPDAVIGFGFERLHELRRAVESQTDLSPDSLLAYLHRRPIRQARWFAMAKHRLADLHNRRRNILLVLYTVAALSAVAKMGGALSGNHQITTAATLTLLVTIGLAGASTSVYLGQNIRSLHHRYNSQLRALQHWFVEYSDLFDLAARNEPLLLASLPRLAEAVVTFERSLLYELADWVSITVDDAMEIAPG